MAKLPLGQKVRQQREAVGLSRERLAAQVGTSSSTIRRLEEGAVPKLLTLQAIAKALNLRLGDLLEDAA